MTVSTIDAFVQYVGDGTTVDFIFEFPSFEVEWMNGVVDRNVVSGSAVLNEDQNNNPGGVFTFDTAPENQSAVVVLRLADFLQLTDYPPFTKFPARDHEEALDKLTMITQQIAYAIFLLEGDATLYVLKSGDSMLGQLNTLTPEFGENAANKFYVDDEITELGTTLQILIDALESGKADNTVEMVTDDPDTLVISDPSLVGDVTINTRTNLGSQIIPNGLVKTGAAGIIPGELLPPILGGALNLIGLWDAAPGDNPDDPDEQGDTYIISNPGTLFIFRVSTGVAENIDVNVTDAIVWIAEPNDQGFTEGWYYLPLTLLPRQASSILCDDAAWPIIAGQLQEAFDRLFDTHLGTAATDDVMASPTDPTVGAVMTVPAFGLGKDEGDGTGNVTDLDAHRVSGFYYFTSTAVGAPTAQNGSLIHQVRNTFATGNPGHIQLAIVNPTDMYIRKSNGGVWEDWKLMIAEGDSPTFGAVTATGDISAGGSLTAGGEINADGGLIVIPNPSTPANTSNIAVSGGAARRFMSIYGGDAVATGGWVRLYGSGDSTDPSLVRLGTGSAAPAIQIAADNTPNCIDKAGTLRRMGWSPTMTATNAVAFSDAHIGGTINAGAAGSYTLPSGFGALGDMIQIVNRSSSNKPITPTGGAILTWLGDGDGATGPRTLGGFGVCTLICVTVGNNWVIYGANIS